MWRCIYWAHNREYIQQGRSGKPSLTCISMSLPISYMLTAYSVPPGRDVRLSIHSALSENPLPPPVLWPGTRLRSLGGGFYVPESALPETELTVGANQVFMPCFTSYPVYGHWLLEALTSLWVHAHVQRLGRERSRQAAPVPHGERSRLYEAFCRTVRHHGL